MITKLLHAAKLGIFDNFQWNNKLDDFNKRNIIYAYNGGGKTTLSSIFRLYSLLEVDEQKQELFRELSTHHDTSIQVEANNKKIEYSPDKGIEKIYVFNCDFITDHIYEGTVSKMKRFDAKVKSNLKDKEINELEKEISEKQKTLDKATEDIAKADERFEDIKKRVSTAFGKKISNKRLTGVEILDLPASPKTATAIEAEIDSNVKDYNMSLQMDQLKADVETLKALTIDKIEVKDDAITDMLSKKLAGSAGAKLKDKINSYKQTEQTEISDGIELWYRKAQVLIQHSNNQKIINCPVCDTDITALADSLISEYHAFFNDEYDQFIRQLCKYP